MRPNSSIAVIGSGISGLSAAWLLSRAHRVTLFESAGRAGGHSNTVDVAVDGRDTAVAIDTGFIVYNTQSYPNLIALFGHCDVPTARSNMSFAVSIADGDYEYSGTGLRGLFGQPSNLFRPAHLGMLMEIRRFFRDAPRLLADDAAHSGSLADYLSAQKFGPAFVNHHIVPMAAAIWSAPAAQALQFPASSFVRFFANHGLLQIKNRPEWRTVAGGSRVYVQRLLQGFRGTVALNRGVKRVTRDVDGVTVQDTQGHVERFDACLIATHADDALRMLDEPSARETDILGAFSYQKNVAVLHTDPSLMPRRRRVWSSWNYIGDGSVTQAAPAVSYWMNKLQPLGPAPDIFVTLNPCRPIAATHTVRSFDYAHPIFDQAAMSAQRQLWSLQGQQRTWFAGSYFGYGFHEDGLQAGLAAAEDIGGVRRPWHVADESGRIAISTPRSDASLTVREAAE